MIQILTILCIGIVLTDITRLSSMGLKTISVWSLIWMIAAYCSSMWVIQLSSEEVYSYLDIRLICLLGFMESFIFISSLFYVGRWKWILAHYPGLMMIFPVVISTFRISRVLPGVSFMAVGATASLATAAIVAGMALFLRWLGCERSWLYIISIISLIIYIFAFGIS